MNKLDLAIQFTSDILRSGICDAVDVNPEVIFKIIEEIEEIAVKKGIINLSHCPTCNKELTIVNLATTGGKQYRVSCDCRSLSGDNLSVIFGEWLK